jgi:hypothetical protein
MAVGALVGIAKTVAKPIAKAVGKQVLGEAADGVGKAGKEFMQAGGKGALESAFKVFKGGIGDVAKNGGKGGMELMEKTFGAFKDMGGDALKFAAKELFKNGGAKGIGSEITKAMMKSAGIPDIGGLGDKLGGFGGNALEKLFGSALTKGAGISLD